MVMSLIIWGPGLRPLVRIAELPGVTNAVDELTGHKTECVYRPYDIVSEGDLDIAAEKLNQFAGKDTGKVSRGQKVSGC